MSGLPALEAVLDELLAVRGATVAALVDGAGDMLAGRSHDDAVMARAAGVMTTTLAAATALGELLPGSGDGDSGASRPKQMMVDLDTGPLLFVPLTKSDRVVVMALESDADLGRARFAVRNRLTRLEELAVEG